MNPLEDPASSLERKPLEFLAGSIERVTYHNLENGYCVLRIKAKGHRELITVIGHLSSVTPGEHIEASGEWIQHREFGLQFKAQFLKTVHPSTLEGIEKYLGSGMIKGIGPHFAKKLVDAFQFEVFEVIENASDRLREVEGIGTIRIRKITSAWKDQKIIREIMVFLQSHGVSTSRAVRIYKTYGEEAISKVQSNPYQLAKDITGIGFKSADQIAQRLGVPLNSLVRARSGIHHVLFEQVAEGHSAYPEKELLQKAVELLGIEEAILQNAIDLEVQEEELYREKIEEELCLYPSSLYTCETGVAQWIHQLKKYPVPWGAIDAEKAIPWVEQKLGIELAPLQKEGIAQALTSKILILTGGPGTGKTTLTRSIVSILQAKKVRIALCSPTGRAAKRLSECTGFEAKTIHRLLKYDPQQGQFTHNPNNLLETDLLILDEASMVDVSLMYSLLKAIPPQAALILIGDVDQIPSVGPGEVLKALIDSQTIPTVKLTQIFRQGKESQIVQNAHQINHGQLPNLERKGKESDFHFIESNDPEGTVQKIVELVKSSIPKTFHLDSIKEIQVLCPMNRGGVGARVLNIELQKALNPNPSTKIERFGSTFAPNDKVMVIANDYDKEVFNGDLGIIESLNLEEQEAIINFEGRKVTFGFEEFDLLALAYATTIHKAQGSEYPAVIVPVMMQHYLMLKRNLIYTGVTRGKRLVILVGEKKALAMAVKSTNKKKRWNKLKERLEKYG